MALCDDKRKDFQRRLLLSRMRILNHHGFYGLLLMHMQFSLATDLETASTDGNRIYFNPDFLEQLSDSELDFVMMHEILHVVLRHCMRTGDRQHRRFNIACDIVVNSIILQENSMDRSSITLSAWGESMHLAPNGQEGASYTAEEVYEMLPPMKELPANTSDGDGDRWDSHDKWAEDADGTLGELWVKRFADACTAIQVRDPSNAWGLLPAFAQRMWEQLTRPQVDWRTILNEFVQTDQTDYSFSPPDRRYPDSPFFLPDLSETGEGDRVSDILFMIDTSASISDKMMTVAYSEIRGAVDQFGGKLRGWLGFFDTQVVEPIPFESLEELDQIKPAGGGGTNFHVIFQYVKKHMADEPPACIIVLTDGYAPFPKEQEAMDIPVLWLINNDRIDPPWGKIARLKV